MLAVLGVQIAGLLVGAVVVEQLFSLPGVGRMLVTDVGRRDITKVQSELLVLTGQRRGEVAGMRWDELDLDAGVWSLPGSRTKNHRPHTVPLAPEAVWQAYETLDRTRVRGRPG